MRAVLQRVISARVEVEGRIVSQIGPGLLVLVGLLESDTDKDAEYICRKILNTRIFNNEETGKPWDLNVMQKGYEVLLVSQFTLYGMLKGNKLDFHVAMAPERAKPFYESFVQRVSKAYSPDAVKDGLFGAMMQVHLVNDGPVTIQLDSRKETSAELKQSGKGSVSGGARFRALGRDLVKQHVNTFSSRSSSGALRTVPVLAVCRFRAAKAPFRTDFQLRFPALNCAFGFLACSFR
ncbi:hypothetical protein R1sor_020037 [Riccia sorocarpa]|uniref:D-aminoacyl-tRNA deacylase n=1 Tax=Riccia sorocarpa TaxID=122646 RepID=A0ABD3IE57_9MARC